MFAHELLLTNHIFCHSGARDQRSLTSDSLQNANTQTTKRDSLKVFAKFHLDCRQTDKQPNYVRLNLNLFKSESLFL